MSYISDMPIAAIPQVVFEDLLQHVDPLIAPTVNHLVQLALERWLKRPQILLLRRDGEDVKFRNSPIKRVRLTGIQYEAVQTVQRRLASCGRYIPLHVVIFTAMWTVVDHLRDPQFVEEDSPAEGVVQDGHLAWVRAAFRSEDEAYYHATKYEHLPNATVIQV